MINKFYKRGFQAGYDAGYKSGLKGSMAKMVMERDLTFMYGTMAMVLVEKHHWKTVSVEKLMVEIQKEWEDIEKNSLDIHEETMAQMVNRRTGIQLEQMVQDILWMGYDEEEREDG